MQPNLSRRRFLRDVTALGVFISATDFALGDEPKASANERLNLGVIGVNGRGAANLHGVESENIVALCDVDVNRAGAARAKHPKATFYQDFRRLLDQKNIDAVVISTPDHMHAIPAVMAMR